MADDKTIKVPAAFEHTLKVLDKHYRAAGELTDAITAINDHSVDLDDDAMAELEKERFRHSIAADAIADALNLVLCGVHGCNHHLTATELYNRACRLCGANIMVEGASHE